ncbi:MAG: hypothetical protein PHS57_00955 [Alphaproteobacteria bacterium]|nr:hypothetical protein [Alphaproteobacteria bacterium]
MIEKGKPFGKKTVHGFAMDGLHGAAKLRPNEVQNGLSGAASLKPTATKTSSAPQLPPSSKNDK